MPQFRLHKIQAVGCHVLVVSVVLLGILHLRVIGDFCARDYISLAAIRRVLGMAFGQKFIPVLYAPAIALPSPFFNNCAAKRCARIPSKPEIIA